MQNDSIVWHNGQPIILAKCVSVCVRVWMLEVQVIFHRMHICFCVRNGGRSLTLCFFGSIFTIASMFGLLDSEQTYNRAFSHQRNANTRIQTLNHALKPRLRLIRFTHREQNSTGTMNSEHIRSHRGLFSVIMFLFLYSISWMGYKSNANHIRQLPPRKSVLVHTY